MVDHGALYVVPATGATAGHTPAHAPLHVDVPSAAKSASNTYTVRLLEFTYPAAPFSVCVVSAPVTGAIVGETVGTGAATEPPEEPPPPQAANVMAASATAGREKRYIASLSEAKRDATTVIPSNEKRLNAERARIHEFFILTG
ncbi:MAG: hypothetical protein NVSMB64_05800 [Candidatus Velthaea sp.]